MQLFTADIPIIVCNPVTTSVEKLLSDPTLPLHHPNAILVITSTSPAYNDIPNSYPIPPSLRILNVDPSEALHGLNTLRSNPGSSLAVQRYQDSFTNSGVPEVTASISQSLSFSEPDPFKALKAQTATYLLQASLSACQTELGGALEEVKQVQSRISHLASWVSKSQTIAHTEAFGSNGNQVVQDAVTQAKQFVRPTLDRLTWWRLLWKVDDIADTVTSSVSRAWCRRLEDQVTNKSTYSI